jgi:hypothetical protein
MSDMIQAFTSARQLIRFFWKSRDCDSRSMVAVTLMMPGSGQVTQGGSINRRGCGGATWDGCGGEGSGETTGLWVGCEVGRVVKGRSYKARRSTTVEEVGSGKSWRREWHSGWLGNRRR